MTRIKIIKPSTKIAYLFLIFLPSVCFAQLKEKNAITNAVKYVADYELQQKIKFVFRKNKVDTIIIKNEYAFFTALPMQLNNRKVDLGKGIYKYLKNGEHDNFFINPIYIAVLQKTNGIWHILKLAVGCTDICYDCWWKELNVPKDIFPEKSLINDNCK
ncbi:MAG: hypothetical protein QM737_18460 [Ferruginibacter sp.]